MRKLMKRAEQTFLRRPGAPEAGGAATETQTGTEAETETETETETGTET